MLRLHKKVSDESTAQEAPLLRTFLTRPLTHYKRSSFLCSRFVGDVSDVSDESTAQEAPPLRY